MDDQEQYTVYQLGRMHTLVDRITRSAVYHQINMPGAVTQVDFNMDDLHREYEHFKLLFSETDYGKSEKQLFMCQMDLKYFEGWVELTKQDPNIRIANRVRCYVQNTIKNQTSFGDGGDIR